MQNNIYNQLLSNKLEDKKSLAVLIDPDKISPQDALTLVTKVKDAKVDFILVGGSLLFEDQLEEFVKKIKQHTAIPVILFPGSPMQITKEADGLLLLSLISGRNPELLIGHHVTAAGKLKRSGLEIIPTGYMLIDGGCATSVSYLSNTSPIPNDKPDLAVATAVAGELLGLKSLYLDAGSGALRTVTPKMIRAVSANVHIPIIVGGGIKTSEQAADICKAGADMVVVGNVLEERSDLIYELAAAIHEKDVVSPKT